MSAGDRLFDVGSIGAAIYAIRAGSIKTSTIAPNGREYVHGFHLAGEIVGFDAIYSGHHLVAATCLEETSVCSFTLNEVAQITRRSADVEMHLLATVAGEYCRGLLRARGYTVTERLARFLLDMEARTGRLLSKPTAFHLSMSRREVASHIRCSPETLSRSLARLQDLGLVAFSGRQFRIVERERLRCIADEGKAAG